MDRINALPLLPTLPASPALRLHARSHAQSRSRSQVAGWLAATLTALVMGSSAHAQYIVTSPSDPVQRGYEPLLEADVQARRDQFRLQQDQRRQQQDLAWQQEAQRQWDQAPVGERALRLQQEQADRIGRHVQEAQRIEFLRAQQERLQQQRIQPQPFPSPQSTFSLQPPEAVGQQAMREQAQRQYESDQRLRQQQADRMGRDAGPGQGARRGQPGMLRER